MSALFYLVVLQNFLFCLLVVSFRTNVEDIASFFLRGPYKISFGEPYITGEVFDVNNEENHSLDSEENQVIGEEVEKETEETHKKTGDVVTEISEVNKETREAYVDAEELNKDAEKENKNIEKVNKNEEVDREAGEVDREEGEVDKEAGEVEKEAGEVDREEGEVDREEGEVDREEGEVDREEEEVDKEEEEVDKEEGEVDKEEGEVDKEEGEVDREEEEVDREEEEVDTKEGKVEKEAGEIDRETGEIDRETGEIEKEAGEVDREEGEVDKEEEEVEKEAGEVEKEAVEEDREEGEVDKEAGEIDRETGEIEKEAGEVDKEAAEVDREEGEVDRGEGKVDRETGEIEKEEIEVDREEGKVDRETGEIEKEAGEVEKEVGEVDRETGEIEKEAGVEKEVGEVEKEAGEIDRETGEIEKEKVDRNPRGVDKEKTELENLKLNAQIKKRIPIEEVIKQIGEKYEYVEKLKGYIKANAKKNEAYINDKYDSEISNPTTYLIPGVGGSTLIAQYKNAQINSCGKNTLNSKPFRIWLSLGRLFSIISNIYCTFDTLRLSYDEETNLYYNQKGVIIRTEKYGSLKGVDYLDYFSNTGIRLTRYFNFLSSRFISNGYVDGDSIVGAPYDWRYPLYQQNFEVLKAHIEYSYEMRKTKINLIGHSLGGLYINYFLTRKVDKEWKEKYLNCVIYMNSPFKGSFKTIRALLHGNRDMISFSLSKLAKLSISEGMMKAIGNSIGSLFDLIPYREYYEYDQIVVLMNLDSTPVDQEKIQFLIKSCGLYNQECYTKREDVKLQVFTLSNWHTLLNDELRIRYEKYSPYVDKKFSMDHGIPIYCVYSTDKKKTTEHVLFFQSPDLNKEPYLYFGEGDGTVPLESLKACNNFFNAKEAKHLQNVNHSGILHNSDAAKYIYSKAHVTYE